jgi:probable F420-dependent oxidoreductase
VRFTLQHPIASAACASGFLEPRNVVRFAMAAEAAGFSAIAFTEHPAPSHKWISSGGHDSFDPLTALSFCAAVTDRVLLMTYLLVLPFRNPLLAAKQVATLDVLSGGRAVVGLGAGYLRSEFSALGVEHAERSELLDEGIEAMLGIWSQAGYTFRGRHFFAPGQTARPRPVQQPHPPLWIGGNSARARARAVRSGAGWAPLLIDADTAAMLGTPAIPGVAALRAAIGDLHRRAEQSGRDGLDIDVQVEGALTTRMDRPAAETLDQVGELEEVGVGWMVVDPPADDVERALDVVAAYGSDVIGAGA